MASYNRMTKAELVRLLNQRDEVLHRQDVALAQLQADKARLLENTPADQAGNKRPVAQRAASPWDQRMSPMRQAAARLASQLGRSVTREEVLQHMRA